MKYSSIITGIVVLLFCGACTKDNPGPDGGLNGTIWVPIHARGSIDAGNYSIEWDEPVDANGVISVTYIRDGEEIGFSSTFSGYHFYRSKRQNVYSTFVPGRPGHESNQARYYVKDGRIYLEMMIPTGSPYSSSSQDMKPSGNYTSFVLEESSPDQMSFGGVTYQKTNRK